MLAKRSFGVAGLVFVAFVFLSVGLAVAQPDNDRFADAIEVFDLPFEDRADLGEAGIEPGERMESCGPIENTVWYAVTLPDTTLVSVDTRGSDHDTIVTRGWDHDTIVVVWTGSGLGDLQIVECNDDTPFGAEAAVEFFAEGGETYFVQVGSFGLVPSGISATLVLSISEGPLGFDTGPFAVEVFPEFGDEFGLVAGELFFDEGGTVPAIVIGFLALWLALATWVYFDALERRRPPIAWAGAVFLLGWVLLIPLFLYLIFRDRPPGPAVTAGAPRRTYFSIVSFSSLAVVVIGLSVLIGALIQGAIDSFSGHEFREAMATSVATIVIGTPIWLYHWQRSKRLAGDLEDEDEVRATLRQHEAYHYVVFGLYGIVAALLALWSLGGALGDAFGLTGIELADWLGPLGPLAVVLATIAYHYWWSFSASHPPSVD